MTKTTFTATLTHDEYGIATTTLHLPFLNQDIRFELFTKDDTTPAISAKMYATVTEVLQLPEAALEQIKTLLWEECTFAFTVSDYGCEAREGESALDAHLREFGLRGKQDAWKKCHLQSIRIHHESDRLAGKYAEIKIDTATDNLISIIVKDGRIIDYDDDGTYLGWFEDDEQKAHHDRAKVLADAS